MIEFVAALLLLIIGFVVGGWTVRIITESDRQQAQREERKTRREEREARREGELDKKLERILSAVEIIQRGEREARREGELNKTLERILSEIEIIQGGED